MEVGVVYITVHAFILAECCESIPLGNIYAVIDFETISPKVEGLLTLPECLPHFCPTAYVNPPARLPLAAVLKYNII